MSVALALCYCFRRLGGVRALPVADIDLDRRATSTCNDLNNCRTASDIIWSCLTTVFMCTWVAVHPNIPAPYETSFEIGVKRFGIVLAALLAPELVILWAMLQFICSRRLELEYRSKGWTKTHAFFALMGGFMLFDGEEALYTLSPKDLNELSKEGKIVFPKITKREIEDKSKGDAISKGFVIVQTSWFILQCVARGVEHLPITELELVTLAYAILNFAIYALWWNKPQNVQRPCPVQLLDASSHPTISKSEGGDSEVRGICHQIKRASLDMQTELEELICQPPWVTSERTIKKVLFLRPGDQTKSETWMAALISGGLATTFGALHCIAWSFQFPSRLKEILWRTCSLIITCLPMPVILMALLLAVRFYEPDDAPEEVSLGDVSHAGVSLGDDSLGDDSLGGDDRVAPTQYLYIVLMGYSFIFSSIYMYARVILLVEAFVLLQSLPPGAFQTVQWTTFIPHV